jgi:hypothetical protein
MLSDRGSWVLALGKPGGTKSLAETCNRFLWLRETHLPPLSKNFTYRVRVGVAEVSLNALIRSEIQILYWDHLAYYLPIIEKKSRVAANLEKPQAAK